MKTFLFAFYQLTRIPMPALTFDEKACGRSTAFFPAVGLVLGAIMSALWWAAGRFFPVYVQTAILLAGMVLLTGGIHLDGFIDSMDGLLSGKQKEQKLEIMRDSRVGAFGVIGLFYLLLLKFFLICEIPDQIIMRSLMVVPALSRWGMVIAIAAFPYARNEGLGKIYSIYTGNREMIGASIIAAAVSGTIIGAIGFLFMTLCGVITLLIGKKLVRELGGLTGDTYGFINEVLEVLLFAAVFPLFQITGPA